VESCATAFFKTLASNTRGAKKIYIIPSPSFFFFYRAGSLFAIGAKPILVDSDYDTFNISIKDTKRKLTNRTKALIMPHMFGLPCDIDEFLGEIIKNKDLVPLLNNILDREDTLTEDEIKELQKLYTSGIHYKAVGEHTLNSLDEFFAFLLNRALDRNAEEKRLERKRERRRKNREYSEHKELNIPV